MALRFEGKDKAMILAPVLAPLFGASLVVTVATGPIDDPMGAAHLSAQEKSAATEPLVRSATDCIVHAVVADPRYGKAAAQLGDLIVASMPACVAPVRAMIDAYDQYYGEGSGESFFMGPYLDLLPKLVMDAGKKAAAP
jgi:hypothetical protein